MKKTLIALAVLAASGASFAQVTITGNLTMGWAGVTTGTATTSTDTSGLGVDTSQINFAATEDLGGGMSATAKMSLAGADRSGESSSTPGNTAGGGAPAGNVTGRDASLTLVTSVGAISLASVQAADYLTGGIAGVGGYYQGFNGKVHGFRSNRDTITYALPVGAFTLAISAQEPANRQGLGAGVTGTAGQRLVAYVASYAKGAVAANGTYLNYSERTDNSDASTRDAYRLSGSYDFGVVKVGAGVQLATQTSNAKILDSAVGVAVPLGAVTLSANWVSRNVTDLNAATTSVPYTAAFAGGLVQQVANGTNTGYALQAAYSLSKRTAVIGNYAKWDSFAGVANASSMYLLALSHSF